MLKAHTRKSTSPREKKWKYAKPQEKKSDTRFLQFEDGEKKVLALSNWSFERGSSGYLFKCYVEKENGEETDMMWFVWDCDTAEALKKRIGLKYSSGAKEVTVTMHRDEDDFQTFEVA